MVSNFFKKLKGKGYCQKSVHVLATCLGHGQQSSVGKQGNAWIDAFHFLGRSGRGKDIAD